MPQITLEIVIDEQIYNHVKRYVEESTRNEKKFIIAQAPMPSCVTKCCFFYYNASDFEELKSYINEVNESLGADHPVRHMLIHDSIFKKIVEEELSNNKRSKARKYLQTESDLKSLVGTEIIKALNTKPYQLKVELCSQVTGKSRVIPEVFPISRKKYKDLVWHECSPDDIKKDTVIYKNREVAEDYNHHHFEDLIIEILYLQLVRYWMGEVEEKQEEDMEYKLDPLGEEYMAYEGLGGYPDGFCQDERNVVGILLKEFAGDREEELDIDDFKKNCEKLAEILRNLNIQG